ncbi:GGDEF domain-containing protein [Halotia wernerae UHCC 0503]|nr:GGDEF domain-containing protein [Halotia wernerae UHCC 0503]
MKISILVFGSNNFLGTLPDQIRDTTAYILEVITITDFHQTIAHIQITPPDIILVQASMESSTQLCSWLKEQTQLSWIYSIFLEDRPEALANKSKYGWEWELQMTAIILNQGADAYIWQLPEEKINHNLRGLTANDRLIFAHLTVGLRKVQKYRDLIQKNDLLSAIALADSLTELNNRRALEWDLPRQIQKAQNQSIPLSLIILDVDYFKKVNDTYGHLVGDRILQLLCSRLRHNLRSQDTAFRYGGEEFVVVLANTIGDEALLVADRLNRVVNEQPFAINSKLTIDITISLGTASLEVGDDDKGLSLLHRADQCLFHAKVTGRNQAISWEHLSRFSHLQAVSS